MSRAFDACQRINQQLDQYKVGDYLLLGTYDEVGTTYNVVVVTKVTKGVPHLLTNDFYVYPRINAKFLTSGHESTIAVAKWKNFGGSAYTPDFRWTLDWFGHSVNTDRMKIKEHMERAIEIERIREEEKRRNKALAEEKLRQANEQLAKNNQLVSRGELDDLARQMRR